MGNLSLKATLELIDKVTRPLKVIDQATKQATEALKINHKAVKDLERVTGDVNSFKALQQELGLTEAKLKATTETENQLAAAFKAAQNPTRGMERELNRATAASDKLKAIQSQQITQLGSLKAKLASAGFETKGMAASETQLDQKLRMANMRLEDQKQKLKQVEVQQKRMATAQKQYAASQELQGKIRGAGAGAAIGAGVGAAAMSVPINAYAEAEDARTQLKVSMMGAGGKVSADFEKINTLANKLGDRLPGTTADFQNMMTMLVRQGIPAQNILGGVGESAAYLGVQLKMAPEAAAEFAAKMQDATRTASGDMLGLMDLIQRGFYSGVDSNNMLEAFKNLGPVMDMIKKKGLDGSKALAPFVVMLDQAGMRGESGGNAIRKIVTAGFDTGKINKALEGTKDAKGNQIKMNFTNGKGEFGGIDNMMAQLAKLQSLTTEQRQGILKDMFGTDAEVNMTLSTIIEKGKAGYDEVVAKMAAQADLQTRVNQQLGTLKNLYDAASGTFTNAMANFGEALSPELKALTKWIGDVSGSLSAWAKENPTTANTIMKIVGVIILLLAAVSTVSAGLLLILGPMALLRLSFMTTIPALWGGAVAAWAFLAPFLPLIIAIGFLATAAYLLYTNWGQIVEFFYSMAIPAWEAMKNGAAAFGEGIKFVGGMILDYLTAPLRLAIDAANLLISGLNRIPNVKIPPIPQIPTVNGAPVGATNRPIVAGGPSPLRSSTNQPYTIHNAAPVININGAQDTKAVGAEVKRQLDAHSRAQDARARSSLKDKE